MASELVQEYAGQLEGQGGSLYAARAFGERREDGNWEGWIEFQPAGGGQTLRTGRETTQPDRDALAYWASGLEPVYLEGALGRAS